MRGQFVATNSFRAGVCALFVLLYVPAGGARAADLEVRLPPLPPGTRVVFQIFTSANTFTGLRSPARTVAFETAGTNAYRLTDVPGGEYALLVYVDENRNERLDRNFLGIPVEPVGFPNGYRPKGPPLYRNAVIAASEDGAAGVEVELNRPLGRRGQLGVGVGVIAQSSPYRGADGAVYQVIPTITYIGDRLQILGPYAQFGIVSRNHLRVAATATYRLGAYEEDGSPILAGLGDRDDTLALGLAIQGELPAGFNVSAGYDHDVLDRAGGGLANLGLERGFQWDRTGITPGVTLRWLSADQANYDFGVAADKATPERPAYRLDDTLSVKAKLSTFVEISDNTRVFISTGIEFLDSDVRRSPIVEEDHVLHAFVALTYAL